MKHFLLIVAALLLNLSLLAGCTPTGKETTTVTLASISAEDEQNVHTTTEELKDSTEIEYNSSDPSENDGTEVQKSSENDNNFSGLDIEDNHSETIGNNVGVGGF